MNKYNVIFVNNSNNDGDFLLFQQNPGISSDFFPLAWFTQFVNPGVQTTYTWQIDYDFLWAETGTLIPGVIFQASQFIPVPDISKGANITLTDADGAFDFINLGAGPIPGSMVIHEDGTIPADTASVGIAMSGAGTFATQAQPNINLTYTPTPQYWCGFGTYTQGEVLSIQSMTGIQQISFPDNVYTMYAILNKDNTWTISQVPPVNSLFANAKKKNPKIKINELDFSKL